MIVEIDDNKAYLYAFTTDKAEAEQYCKRKFAVYQYGYDKRMKETDFDTK